jgi:hypothetical protein
VDEHPPPVIIGDIDDGEGDGDEDVLEDSEPAAGVDGPESVALGPVQTVPKRFSEAGGSAFNNVKKVSSHDRPVLIMHFISFESCLTAWIYLRRSYREQIL